VSVLGEIELALRGIVAGAGAVAAALAIERDLGGVGKRPALLDELVAHQPEDAALRERHRLLVQRAVGEAEGQLVLDALALGVLDELAVGDRGAARLDDQEAVGDGLGKADGDRRRGGGRHRREREDDGEERRERSHYLPAVEQERCRARA